MDDATVNNFIALITEQMLALAQNLTELQAAVHVLKGLETIRMSPDDPLEGAKQLRNLETTWLESDLRHQELKKVTEIIDAVKLLQKRGIHGGGKDDS